MNKPTTSDDASFGVLQHALCVAERSKHASSVEKILAEEVRKLESATATSARLLDFFIAQCQGDSGAGESYWEQFPQYKIAQAYVAQFKPSTHE